MDPLVPTKGSLEAMRSLMSRLEGVHFHEHLHVVHDVLDRAGEDGVHYMEIGTYHGCSAIYAALHPAVSRVTSIDPFLLKGQAQTFARNVGSLAPEGIITHIQKKSGDVDTSSLDPVDVLVIDGSHKYADVIQDFELFSPLVKKGGYILFDDYLDEWYSPQVRKAVDHIVANLSAGSFEVTGLLPNEVGAKPECLRQNNTFILVKN